MTTPKRAGPPRPRETATELTAKAVLAGRGVVTVGWLWQRARVWGRLQKLAPSARQLAAQYLDELQLELLGGE